VEDAPVYYDLLEAASSNVDIWETEYLQLLTGDDPVLEWVKGTGLRPILNALGDQERARYLTEYAHRLRIAYPARANGQTLYPFRRLFIVASRA
jgi:trans-aconitate 2-methyltransferase